MKTSIVALSAFVGACVGKSLFFGKDGLKYDACATYCANEGGEMFNYDTGSIVGAYRRAIKLRIPEFHIVKTENANSNGEPFAFARASRKREVLAFRTANDRKRFCLCEIPYGELPQEEVQDREEANIDEATRFGGEDNYGNLANILNALGNKTSGPIRVVRGVGSRRRGVRRYGRKSYASRRSGRRYDSYEDSEDDDYYRRSGRRGRSSRSRSSCRSGRRSYRSSRRGGYNKYDNFDARSRRGVGGFY